jgi:predicted NBD/HSP70 family sugar kinase
MSYRDQRISTMETPRRARILSIVAALAFAATTMIAGYRNIGLPPVVIVGGSSAIALVMWVRTYLRKPLDPDVILPLFLLTVAALEVHMAEEYLTGFGPAMSRLFDISWTERSFLMVFAFVGPALYALTALGLYYKVPLAGFLAWFIFIGPGVAEFTHFIFPLLRPAIAPDLPGTISQAVSNGRFVAGMRNYYVHTTGVYYFSGMYTAVLPMIPGILAIRRVIRASRVS